MNNRIGGMIAINGQNDADDRWNNLTEKEKIRSINELIEKRLPVHRIGEKISLEQLQYDAVDEVANIFDTIENSDLEVAGMEARDGFLDIYAKATHNKDQKIKIVVDLTEAKTTFGFSREVYDNVMPDYLATRFAGYGVDVYGEEDVPVVHNPDISRGANLELAEKMVYDLHEKIEKNANLIDSGYTDDKSCYCMMYAGEGLNGKYEASVVTEISNPRNVIVFFQNTDRVDKEAAYWKTAFGITNFKRKEVFSEEGSSYDKMPEEFPPLEEDLLVEYYPPVRRGRVNTESRELNDGNSENPPVGGGVMNLEASEPGEPSVEAEAKLEFGYPRYEDYPKE